MKQLTSSLLLVVLLFTASGCYHAQVVTEKEPSSTVIDRPWAMSFVFGLIPPPVVETAQECPNGVARVETRISFLNGLVAALSANIITPMHIRVTCAEGGAMGALMSPDEGTEGITVPRHATQAEVRHALQRAATQSAATQASVSVRFQQ